jgi:hypothetical protein
MPAKPIQRATHLVAVNSRLHLGFTAAGNGDQCDFIGSWTIRDRLSVVLQLKSVGIERPKGHATEPLVTAFSLVYSAA